MTVVGVLTSVLVSLTAAPLVLIVANYDFLSQPIIMMTIGFGVLALIALLFKLFLSPSAIKPPKSLEGRGLLYYTCCVFLFGCVADFTIQTCHVNIFSCGKNAYLLHGEPYLQTPFGITSQFWNSIVHYLLQVLIIYQIDNYQDCRIATLYWCGSIVTSQFVVLTGALSGSYSDSLEYAVWLNVIFAGLPLWIFCKFLSKPMLPMHLSTNSSSKRTKPKTKSKLKFFDIILYVLMLYTICFNLLRGLGALDSKFPIIAKYVQTYEPYINEPAQFGKCWALYTAVYIIPYYFAVLYNFTKPVSLWVVNLSVFFAAGLLQGTFVYLSYSWYPSSVSKYRIRDEYLSSVLAANILLVITAHFLMYHTHSKWGYFNEQSKAVNEPKKRK